MSDSKDNALGDFIHEQREAAGLSIRQAAEAAGLHYSFWSRIESGDRRKIDPKDLQRIAKVLRVDPSVLLAFIGVEPVLPEPQVYFRRAYGMSEHEADQAAQIIENLRTHQREQQTKGGSK